MRTAYPGGPRRERRPAAGSRVPLVPPPAGVPLTGALLTGALLTGVLLLAGCSHQPTGLPDQQPTVGASAPLASCPASVRVPAQTTTAVLDPHTPTTAVLTTGAAVSFAVPTGYRLVTFGNGHAAPTVCRATAGSADRAVVVARAAGYVRLALQNGGQDRVLYLRVTS